MKELLDEYEKKFDEQFPLRCFMAVDEKEIEAVIKKCLESNKPYEPDKDKIY